MILTVSGKNEFIDFSSPLQKKEAFKDFLIGTNCS
jgi:hypothetical protein